MFILMIDDEPSSVKSIADLLSYMEIKRGWQFYYSNESNLQDIKQDLEKNLRDSPDVILLDIGIATLPTGSTSDEAGLELLEEIRKGKFLNIDENTKIIAMSGQVNVDEIMKFHGDKIDNWLPKPSDLARLEELLISYST